MQKRVPPIVREVIQPSTSFHGDLQRLLCVLYDVLGELLTPPTGKPRSTKNCKFERISS